MLSESAGRTTGAIEPSIGRTYELKNLVTIQRIHLLPQLFVIFALNRLHMPYIYAPSFRAKMPRAANYQGFILHHGDRYITEQLLR